MPCSSPILRHDALTHLATMWPRVHICSYMWKFLVLFIFFCFCFKFLWIPPSLTSSPSTHRIRNIEEHASADVEKMVLGNKCDVNDKRQVSCAISCWFLTVLSTACPSWPSSSVSLLNNTAFSPSCLNIFASHVSFLSSFCMTGLAASLAITSRS